MGEEQRPATPPRFVPLPTAVVDDWVPVLTGSQLKLLLVVVRQTEGFRDPATGKRRAEDWLSQRQLMARTGCASEAVAGAVDALVRAGLVRVRAEDGGDADTPQRRRAASRLLYGLGPALLPGSDGERTLPPHSSSIPEWEADTKTGASSETGVRKSNTTKETVYKRDHSLVVFENRTGARDGDRDSDKSQDQDSFPCTPRSNAGGKPRSRAVDVAGTRWVWRKADARWVSASAPLGDQE